MVEEKQVGFWQRYFIACFRPSRYTELFSKKKGVHVGYLLLLMVFLFFIEGIIPFAAWDITVGGYRNLVLNRVPEFTIQDGVMKMDNPMEFTIGQATRVCVSSDVEKYKADDFDNKYSEEILVSSTNILFKAAGRMTEVSMDSFKGRTINNETLASASPLFHVMVGIYFIVSFLTCAARYLIQAGFFAILCRVGVRTEDGRTVSFKQVFLIALYARTLFAVLESINICLGYLVSDFLLIFLSAMVTMSYIYRAQAELLKPRV